MLYYYQAPTVADSASDRLNRKLGLGATCKGPADYYIYNLQLRGGEISFEGMNGSAYL